MADNEKKAFTFFRSYFEAAKELSDKQRLSFYDAIIQYGIDGEEIELGGVAKAMFTLVKPTLDKSQARVDAGSKGGKSKAKTNDEQTPSKPQAKTAQTASDISEDKDIGLRIKDEDEETGNTSRLPQAGGDGGATDEEPPKADPDAEFEQFWFDYPKKIGKGDALKAWKKLKPSAVLREKILIAINRQKNSEQWLKNRGQYIPNPATWLNGGRWDDEIEDMNTRGRNGEYSGQNDSGRQTTAAAGAEKGSATAGFKSADDE